MSPLPCKIQYKCPNADTDKRIQSCSRVISGVKLILS